MTEAKIIADSISPGGVRLTTMQVTFHRFVLAEMNTHRVFSRNSASSRAIPFRKQVDRLLANPALPVKWASEQKGMQGGDEIADVAVAREAWLDAREDVLRHAEYLHRIGVHKSLINRLLEPWMWHTAIITSTAWQNFFEQRVHEAAQPEIRVAAEMMYEAYIEHDPQRLIEGEWHLPYVEAEDWKAVHREFGKDVRDLGKSMYPQLTKISAARCARVSYLTQEGTRDIAKDLELYDRLTDRQKDAAHANDPIHWSPLEHVATPWLTNRQEGDILHYRTADGTLVKVDTGHLPKVGNLLGWRSLRTTVETERGAKTFR